MASRSRGITAEHIESFLYANFPDPSPILEEVDKFGQDNGIPIIGPLVGRFLHLLVKICKPKSILEIGTAIGYSTIWLASALPASSALVTVEIDEERFKMARRNIDRVNLSRKVRLLLGDATKLIPSMNETFDFIFLDTEKSLYPLLLPKLIDLLPIEGLLVADNTLWGGKVATNDRSSETLAVKEFDTKIINDKRLYSIIIPIRDGVSLSLKMSGQLSKVNS